MKNLLYIGINGYAGSGKDTVAKMLKIILGCGKETLEECKEIYKSIFTNPTKSVTYDYRNNTYFNDYPVFCIAYADQLKYICSAIFGIPVDCFYMNKSNGWVCINRDFQYTEIKPEEHSIISADEFYYGLSEYMGAQEKYWMSLREILVYVGTYVLQHNVNCNIFVNIVRNKIKEHLLENKNFEYVIVTDNRFTHELEFIRNNNGITIRVERDSVQQLDNVAEHDLDDENEYDYIIKNNGSYDDLFQQIWDIVHSDIEFQNKTVQLGTRDEIQNYLRLINSTDDIDTYLLCSPYNIQNVYHDDYGIFMINPTGGPIISRGETISGTDIIPYKIEFHMPTNKFVIHVKR